jgi:hypothetical protein
MSLELSFPVFLRRLDVWLLAALVAFSAGCNAPDNDATATSPAPAASPATESSPAILTLAPANGFEGATELANVKIARTSQGLVIQALTADPSILLPRFAVTGQSPLKVHVQFVSPGANGLQVFYDTKEHRDSFDEAHSIRKPTQKGENNITVDITDPGFGGRIRLDPGDLTGEYVIKLIEVRP